MDLSCHILVLWSHNKVCVAHAHVQMNNEEGLIRQLYSICIRIPERLVVSLIQAGELEKVDHQDYLDGGVVDHVFKVAHDRIKPPLFDEK